MRLLAALVLLPLMSVAFEPPSAETRRAAVGDLNALPAVLRRAFAPDSPAFAPIPKPGPGDWLAVYDEPGQTFDEFSSSNPNLPTPARRILYFQPLGEFAPSMEKLREFGAAFFAMEVKVLPAISTAGIKLTTRRNPLTGRNQILTGDVLDFLKTKIPSDAFCILSITMEDLFPEPSWNFVFGQASLRDRVGVYSLARYDPAFFGQQRPDGYQALMMRRSCNVLAHETGHMFGLAHCTYFHCLMNGSNHLAESDRQPLDLCPVCLRKLQWSIGFDVLKRYQALQLAMRSTGLNDEAEWLERRLKTLRGK